jgi:tetratricopeptide (TPR) repeat protein
MSDDIYSDRWYLNIVGQIEGPVSTWEIIRRLTAKEIKVIYRASKDRQTWKAICNEEHFEKSIKELIELMSRATAEMDTSEIDVVNPDIGELSGLHNLEDVSKGISEQLSQAQQLEEISYGISNLREILTQIQINRKTIIEEKVKIIEEAHPDDLDEVIALDKSKKIVGWDIEEKNKDKIKRIAIVSAVCTVLLAGGLYYYSLPDASSTIKDISQKTTSSSNLEEYKDILDGKPMPEHSNDLVSMAETLIQKGQFQKSSKILVLASQAQDSSNHMDQIRALQGLVSYKTNNFKQAKISLEESIIKKEQFASLFNMGLIYLKEGLLLKAEKNILRAIKAGNHDIGPAITTLIEISIQINQQKIDSNFNQRMTQIERLIETYLSKGGAHQQEIIIANVLVKHLLQKKWDNTVSLYNFINSDPIQSKNQNLSIYVDNQYLKWTHLYGWCLEVYTPNRNSPLMNAFFASCLMRVEPAKEAIPYIEFASKSEINNYQFKSLLAYTHLHAQNNSLSFELIKSLPARQQHKQPLVKNIIQSHCEDFPSNDLCIGSTDRGLSSH